MQQRVLVFSPPSHSFLTYATRAMPRFPLTSVPNLGR